MSLDKVRQSFGERFGGTPETFGIAPGRVNLIGEHTDYNEGYVFPAAIDKEVWIAARRTDGPSHIYSLEVGKGKDFHTSTTSPGDADGWTAYAAGVAWALRERSGKQLPNIEACIHGEVPIGSGISSSAALELAFAVTWNELAGLGYSNKELAHISQVCENKYVGVNSGIMDQMASAMGKAGNALFLDTKTLDIQYAPMPAELSIVLCDTGKPRALTDSAYNERRSQCEEGAEILGVGSLREATMQLLQARREEMPPVIYRRARHVVSENARCIEFVTALDHGDQGAIGRLMRASHESLRNDYEVSSSELDAMASACWNAKGCVGARMTGAGFGGACVALVKTAAVVDFIESVRAAYKPESGVKGSFLPCRAADGARIIDA